MPCKKIQPSCQPREWSPPSTLHRSPIPTGAKCGPSRRHLPHDPELRTVLTPGKRHPVKRRRNEPLALAAVLRPAARSQAHTGPLVGTAARRRPSRLGAVIECDPVPHFLPLPPTSNPPTCVQSGVP